MHTHIPLSPLHVLPLQTPNTGSNEDGFGERALWAAVITQALMDAASHSKKPEAIKAKEEAIQWLKGDSTTFFEVCEMAGYDPGYVRMMSGQALARQCRWRNTPKSPRRPSLTPATLKARASGEKRRRGRPRKQPQPHLLSL